MFEKRVREISNSFGKDSGEKEFYVLTHRKHQREVYFQNTKRAIDFMSVKFKPSLKKFRKIKKIFYFLIKTGVLQIFLKKIRLSRDLGDVVFIGGQIKGFDLGRKEVLSFPLEKNEREDFIRSKKIQKEFSKEGFAPQIFKLNEGIPFSEEEFLKEYHGGRDEEIFKRLFLLYNKRGIEKIPAKKYINALVKELKEKGIYEDSLNKILTKIIKQDTNLIVARIHGDFSRGQVLLKNDSYVFIDWDSHEKKPKKNLLMRDLATFFREDPHILKNKFFLRLLKMYPKEIREDIRTYLVLNEINTAARRGIFSDFIKQKIKNILRD